MADDHTYDPKNKGHLRITNWIENVLGLAGEVVGRARVSDKGEIQASIDVEWMARETYQLLAAQTYGSLSIHPSGLRTTHYTDEVRTRLDEQNPLRKKD